jgi:ABC-2 type transport system permease protein
MQGQMIGDSGIARRSAFGHRVAALRAVCGREIAKFIRQPSRLISSLVRPLLWFVVFAAGFHNVFGVSVVEPYETYVDYQTYMVPGLLGMVALFNGMQSSLSLVYDREMGFMRLLLTAPLARGWLLAFKLLAGTCLSFLQILVFALIAMLFGVAIEWAHLLAALPTFVLAAALLASLGLLLSVYIKQLENFAGTMNFVIFPMFFISSALFPLWKFREAGANWLAAIAQANPFTYAVEMIRYALAGKVYLLGLGICGVGTLLFFLLALWGYDPQRGWIRHKRGGS